ncbi:MAG: class D beta-lactamase [Candidatus Riflebacteria bacterium]|nr:class D beta-lactamase [Candidatus Riflebacteria bacterium]
MKKIVQIISLSVFCFFSFSSIVLAEFPVTEKLISEAFVQQKGTCVFIDCSTGKKIIFNPEAASIPLPPCSTFKIWNALLGFESGIISSPDELFWKWDGQTYSISDWNKDLTLKEAFKASCVPAFKNLARNIGSDKMKKWLEKIHYGDRDISSGIDNFWLPTVWKKSILISALEQAELITKLVTGKIPCSEKSGNLLKEIMLVKCTDRGTFYGKTGTASEFNGRGGYNLGWFVGYVKTNNNTYSFACLIKGENLMGKDARDIVEKILAKAELL